jgi:outer membrane protein TolC
MKHRPPILALLLLTALLAPVGALARPAQAPPTPTDTLRLTLDDALRTALARSEEMRMARAFTRRTEGVVLEQLSRALPQVSGSVMYDRKLSSIFSGLSSAQQGPIGPTLQDSVGAYLGQYFGQIFSNSSFAAKNTWTVDLQAQQLLWSGGKVGAALSAARAAHREAHANEQEQATTLGFQVRRAYYDAALAARMVEIAETALTQARAHQRQVEAGRREGNRSEYEALRAEVDAANQEPAAIAARSGQEIALLDLKRLVNVPLAQPVVLVTPLVPADGTVPVVTRYDTAIDGRPALAAANYEVEARRHAVRVYQGQRWPDLYASTDLSHQAFPGTFWPKRREFMRNWDAVLRLEIPIFTGLRTEGQVKQARADYETALASRDALREAAGIQATQARDEIDRALSTLLARRETVRQARRAWQLAGVRFTNGMSTQIEVSDARLQLSAAEVNEVQAMRDYRVAIAALEQAVGHVVPVESRPLEQVIVPNSEGSPR